MRLRTSSAAALAAASLLLAACGGGSDTPAPVTPTAVVPLPDAFTLAEGEVAPLAAVVLPDPGVDQAVTWTSAKPAVATVGGSLTSWTVRGRSRGTVQLTVASVQDPSKTATVTVEVFKPATLSWTPASASFIDPVAQVLQTTLVNGGDRPATGVSLTVTYLGGSTGWLQAATAGGASLDLAAGGQVPVDVAIDPAGLPSGLHAAEVSLQADPEVDVGGNPYTVVLYVP